MSLRLFKIFVSYNELAMQYFYTCGDLHVRHSYIPGGGGAGGDGTGEMCNCQSETMDFSSNMFLCCLFL